jgi:TrmH family RNA methyltransferase
MANFGLSDLRLVTPRADPLSLEARAMACSAHDLLAAAKVADSLPDAVAECRWVCGTTARLGERRRAQLTPRTAASELLATAPSALVFGPEDTGLSGADLDLCHAVLTIPVHPGHESLNLAQAVAVAAYELWTASLRTQPAHGERHGHLRAEPRPPATAQELEEALAHVQEMLEAIGYFRQTAPEHPLREIRRFLARAQPTRYELSMLRGVCRKTLNTLRHAGENKETNTPDQVGKRLRKAKAIKETKGTQK